MTICFFCSYRCGRKGVYCKVNEVAELIGSQEIEEKGKMATLTDPDEKDYLFYEERIWRPS